MKPLLVMSVLMLVAVQPAAAQLGAVGGVYIDSEGVLRDASQLTEDELLEMQRLAESRRPENQEVQAASPLRKVSLKRLEAQLRDLHASNQSIPPSLRYLAGLERIQYVLFYPEQQDVILAGPAGAWKPSTTGEMVSVNTGAAVMQVDDLIVALRYACTENPPAPFIGCSIEPTAQGMQNYNNFMRSLGGGLNRSQMPQIIQGMQQAMGMQAVKIFGIPADSHFALKMAVADYRLKRIALGHDPSPVNGVVNYLDLASKRLTGGRQPQQRWWFAAEFDALEHSADELAWEFQGQGIKVTTAPGLFSAPGQTQATPAAKQLATALTKHYPELSRKVPVFGELQNLIALSVAAELIASRRETGWQPEFLLNEQECVVGTFPVPKEVASLANWRFVNNQHWLISISGGVEISPAGMIRQSSRPAEKTDLPEVHTKLKTVPADRWWWD